MKIVKLSKAELQKIYSRPSIFIMVALFILTILVSAFIYTVPNRSNGIVTIPGSTVQQIYNFYHNQSNYESQYNYDALLTSIESTITAYETPTTSIEDLTQALNDIRAQYTSYSVAFNTGATDVQLDNMKHSLKTKITDFRDLYNDISNETYMQILVSETTETQLLQFLGTCETTIVDDDDVDNGVVLNNLNALDFIHIIELRLDEIEPFAPATTTIDSLINFYLPQIDTRLIGINDQITLFYTTNTLSVAPADLASIKQLISNYKLTIEQFEVIAYNSMYLNVFAPFTNDQVNQYIGFESTNLYELEENLTRNLYLFDNIDYSYNYANPFSVASPSNTTVNAFDFAYFALELFSFIVIIYVVVIGAGMIAGEEENGTMKLLAIRPYKRYKIFLGKLLGALRIGFVFLLIGGIASFITGFYLYGATSLPILSIFNANTVMVLSPYVMFLIYLATLFIEVLFYLVIAISISSIFKSYAGAVSISILIYFLSMILSFISGTSFLKYIPLTNTNLFQYFGASFISQSSGLNALLTPAMLNDVNILFSSIILGVTMLVFLFTALKVFSKRDLK